MKYSANLPVNGQKAGLMVLVDSRNWYGVSKTNVGGGGVLPALTRRSSDTSARKPVASILALLTM